jgi:hypothetical protein
MKTLVFLVLALLTAALVVASDPSLGDRERKYVEDALDILGMDEAELGFEKRWAVDSLFRLSIVDTLMARPLYCLDYADISKDEVENAGGELPGLLAFAANGLGFPGGGDDTVAAREVISASGLPSDLTHAIGLLLSSFRKGDLLLEDAFGKLTPSEKSMILVNAPVLWSDEDDSSDDYLEGILHREFGLEPDTSEELETDTLLRISHGIDMQALASAGIVVSRAASEAREELGSLVENFGGFYPRRSASDVDGDVVFEKMTEWGRVVVGGPRDNSYYGRFAVIIDLGGNDRYFCRAGGAVGVLANEFSVVLDMKGDDTYSSDKVFNMGAGIFGVGVLIDAEGNDTYRGSHYSFGAGLFGVGVMYDGSGDDFYEGGYCVQGAGNFGYGIQVDMSGNDTYRSYNWAQGFGSVWGYGLLADYGGNDIYYAGGKYIHHPLLPYDYRSFAQGFGMGWRPNSGGGIGFLYDKEGNDFYDAEVFAQATSYWYSVGMLVDGAGNDRYLAAQYAQGSGIHLSVGILVDSDGDDQYVSKYGPGQGEGHDFAVGVLIDKHGEDSYCMSGGQGIGLTNSVGLFIDSEGRDTYATREKNMGQGSGTWARGFGGAGIFLDLMQEDSYPEMSPGADDWMWTQGTYGAGIDVWSDSAPPEPEFEMQPVPDLESMTIEEVFGVASEWEVREAQDRVKAGRKELVRRGMEAVSWVMENRIDTRDGLALRAMEELADSFPDSVATRLMDALEDERFWARANAMYLLGQMKWKPAVDLLLEQIERPGNRKRSAISALGAIGEKEISLALAEYLKDEEEPTRIAAAVALSRLKDDRTVSALIVALEDPMFTVRGAAESALVSMGQVSLAQLIQSLGRGNRTSTASKIRTIARLGSTGSHKEKKLAVRAIRRYLRDDDRTLRVFAVDGLSLLGERETLSWMMTAEDDPIVMARYRTALQGQEK